jgi:hypothetical protein
MTDLCLLLNIVDASKVLEGWRYRSSPMGLDCVSRCWIGWMRCSWWIGRGRRRGVALVVGSNMTTYNNLTISQEREKGGEEGDECSKDIDRDEKNDSRK